MLQLFLKPDEQNKKYLLAGKKNPLGFINKESARCHGLFLKLCFTRIWVSILPGYASLLGTHSSGRIMMNFRIMVNSTLGSKACFTRCNKCGVVFFTDNFSMFRNP